MKNKKRLGFLIITLLLISLMFINVFANSSSGWVCTESNGYEYTKGEIIDKASSIYFEASYGYTAWYEFESDFTVKPGDNVNLAFGAYLYGDNTSIDGAASMCTAQLISENGDVIGEVNFELSGSHGGNYQTSSCKITNATAGKIKLYVYAESPGERSVYAKVTDVDVRVNGQEM